MLLLLNVISVSSCVFFSVSIYISRMWVFWFPFYTLLLGCLLSNFLVTCKLYSVASVIWSIHTLVLLLLIRTFHLNYTRRVVIFFCNHQFVWDSAYLVCSSQSYLTTSLKLYLQVTQITKLENFNLPMPPTHFPLRRESTRDQWWYASPIDCLAANGYYDLVRDLLRIDSKHLFKLTSLRCIRRLEVVWDHEDQFNNVAKCLSQVAQKLLLECESKRGKNSLIRAGYGRWLMHTAGSTGCLVLVQQLLERNPLLAFGEEEYNVTHVFYASCQEQEL